VVPVSVARGTGEADTTRGARRAAAERYNVETRIFRLVLARCWFGSVLPEATQNNLNTWRTIIRGC